MRSRSKSGLLRALPFPADSTHLREVLLLRQHGELRNAAAFGISCSAAADPKLPNLLVVNQADKD